MAGARYTGKSVFIGVLVKQLGVLARALNTSCEPATARTQEIYRTVYERALFVERNLLRSTPKAETQDSFQRDPLIFSLGLVAGRRRYIVLRDVAGEDLEAVQDPPVHLRFFAHADGVVFLFDPLAVPAIRDQLQGVITLTNDVGENPRTVLTNLLRIVGPGTPRVAIVLSKFDAMQQLRAVNGTPWRAVMANAGAGFERDAPANVLPQLNHRQKLSLGDEGDGELLSLEVRSMLMRLGAIDLINSVENPQRGAPFNYRYFAVSALGDSGAGSAIHPRGISSFRCLDPLLWVLRTTWNT